MLAVDEASGIVAYQNLMPIRGLDEVEFLKVLDLFLQTALYWREKCAHGGGEPSPKAEKSDAADYDADKKWMMA